MAGGCRADGRGLRCSLREGARLRHHILGPRRVPQHSRPRLCRRRRRPPAAHASAPSCPLALLRPTALLMLHPSWLGCWLVRRRRARKCARGGARRPDVGGGVLPSSAFSCVGAWTASRPMGAAESSESASSHPPEEQAERATASPHALSLREHAAFILGSSNVCVSSSDDAGIPIVSAVPRQEAVDMFLPRGEARPGLLEGTVHFESWIGSPREMLPRRAWSDTQLSSLQSSSASRPLWWSSGRREGGAARSLRGAGAYVPRQGRDSLGMSC